MGHTILWLALIVFSLGTGLFADDCDYAVLLAPVGDSGLDVLEVVLSASEQWEDPPEKLVADPDSITAADRLSWQQKRDNAVAVIAAFTCDLSTATGPAP